MTFSSTPTAIPTDLKHKLIVPFNQPHSFCSTWSIKLSLMTVLTTSVELRSMPMTDWITVRREVCMMAVTSASMGPYKKAESTLGQSACTLNFSITCIGLQQRETSGNACPWSSQLICSHHSLLSHCGLIPTFKVELVCMSWSPLLKKKVQAGNDLLKLPPRSLRARKKNTTTFFCVCVQNIKCI